MIGIAVSVADITDRKRTEDELKASEAHYRSMVELNPQVLWIMDPQGRNLDVSPRWDKTTGLMVQSRSHNWLKDIHRDDMRHTVRAMAGSRRRGSPIDVRYRVADGEGGWTWKRARGAPRFDVNGEIVCWYGSVQDVGPPEAMEKIAAPASNEVDMAPSVRVVDLSDEESVRERREQALLDLEILDTPAEAEFDDLVKLASEICATPISSISLIDGDRQWFKASIGLNACESPIDWSFCAHAIKQAGLFVVEDATKDERFDRNPLVVGDPHIRFYAGMPLHTSGGVAVGTLNVIDIVPRTFSAGEAKALAILSHQVQTRLELRSERRKLLTALAENRELTAELKHSNQVLAYANSQLELLASTDSLTGVLNRRAFEDRMNAEFSNALRRQRPLSVLVLDVDDFKQRNDTLGHVAGDDALRHLGEVLRKVLRASDIAARVGGEEFAIIFPETSEAQAGQVARRIQELLALAGEEDFPRMTVSIGIACLDLMTRSWEALYSEADCAMYRAKLGGKNRCVTQEPRNVA